MSARVNRRADAATWIAFVILLVVVELMSRTGFGSRTELMLVCVVWNQMRMGGAA